MNRVATPTMVIALQKSNLLDISSRLDCHADFHADTFFGSQEEENASWSGYATPSTENANNARILQLVSKLSEHGAAGFVLANGSMSTKTKGEGAIRHKMIQNDLVNCMIALPGQLFDTTQIPVSLWFLTKRKMADSEASSIIETHLTGSELSIAA